MHCYRLTIHCCEQMTDNHLSCNGDDAIELFAITGAEDDPTITVVDVFGDVEVDGTGEPWEYKDAWARRRDSGRSRASRSCCAPRWRTPSARRSGWSPSAAPRARRMAANAGAALPGDVDGGKHVFL